MGLGWAWHRWLCVTWTTCSRGTCAIAFHHRALDHLAIAALWGAFSKKPTGLLLLNIPEVTPHLGRWQVTADLLRGAAIGRSADGTWRTS